MKARHFWLRNAAGFPVACVASTLMPDSTIAVAISIVNPIDTFDRARGREIALARLEKGKILAQFNQPNPKWAIMNLLQADPGLPKRVRDAAGAWLATHPLDTRGTMQKAITTTEARFEPLSITIGPGVQEEWDRAADDGWPHINGISD